MKIGFIGLGNMGMPMALNLHKSKKIDLLGYDVSAKSLKQFKSKKGKATNSLEDLIKFSFLNNRFFWISIITSELAVAVSAKIGILSETMSLILDIWR